MKKLTLCAGVLALAAVGCGGLGTTDMGGQGGPDLMGARLMSGTYTISNLTMTADDCQKGIANGDTIPLINTQQMLSLGSACSPTTSPVCDMTGYLEGTGPYSSSTMATVSFSAKVTLPDGCSYNAMNTSSLTFTGNNMATLHLTFNETNIDTTKCMADEGAKNGGTSCTSDFTMTIQM